MQLCIHCLDVGSPSLSQEHVRFSWKKSGGGEKENVTEVRQEHFNGMVNSNFILCFLMYVKTMHGKSRLLLCALNYAYGVRGKRISSVLTIHTHWTKKPFRAVAENALPK